MYQINLGLQPNPRATAKKVDKFLTTDFQRYLNLQALNYLLHQDQQIGTALKIIS